MRVALSKKVALAVANKENTVSKIMEDSEDDESYDSASSSKKSKKKVKSKKKSKPTEKHNVNGMLYALYKYYLLVRSEAAAIKPS